MPLSVVKKLNLRELTLITLSQKMSNKIFFYPNGIIEDVLVKVDEFFFSINLAVVDIILIQNKFFDA